MYSTARYILLGYNHLNLRHNILRHKRLCNLVVPSRGTSKEIYKYRNYTLTPNKKALIVHLINTKKIHYIIIKKFTCIMWQKALRGQPKTPTERRKIYWSIFNAIKYAQKKYKYKYVKFILLIHSTTLWSRFKMLNSIIQRQPQYIATLTILHYMPRSHGYRRYKKWARRKKRLQRLRLKLFKYVV